MSIFGENIIENSPVTAQVLQDIIERRKVRNNMSDEERYNRILNHIYKVVEYNINEDIYKYDINIKALNLKHPFHDDVAKEINTYISDGMGEDDLIERISLLREERSREEFWDEKLLKFADYFKSRGFVITCKWKQYIKSLNSKNPEESNIITISWDEKI